MNIEYPLSVAGGRFVVDAGGFHLLDVGDEKLATLIAVSINSHERLVELAREIAKPYEDAADWKDARGRLYAMATAALLEVEREGGMGNGKDEQRDA